MDTRVQEVRVGRNFIRVGDTVKVKPSGKTQFSKGWTVKEIDGDNLRVEKDGKWRYATVDQIQRVAQTKGGERKDR